jgi:hypothetical protein
MNNRELVIDQSIVDAWGLWYLEWQQAKKESLLKQLQSPKRFVQQHLSNELPSSTSDFGNTTTSLVLPSK